MKKIIYLCLIVMMFSGCSTTKMVNRSFNKIDYSDGISDREAKIIAKKKLIDTGSKGQYVVINPDLLETPDTYAFKADYWFVSFKNKPLLMKDSTFLVVVNKETGQ